MDPHLFLRLWIPKNKRVGQKLLYLHIANLHLNTSKMVPWCFGKTATNSNLRGSKGYDSYLSKGKMEGFLVPQNLHKITAMSFGFAMWVLMENRVNKCHGLLT